MTQPGSCFARFLQRYGAAFGLVALIAACSGGSDPADADTSVTPVVDAGTGDGDVLPDPDTTPEPDVETDVETDVAPDVEEDVDEDVETDVDDDIIDPPGEARISPPERASTGGLSRSPQYQMVFTLGAMPSAFEGITFRTQAQPVVPEDAP
jgi:hypothetical protein